MIDRFSSTGGNDFRPSHPDIDNSFQKGVHHDR